MKNEEHFITHNGLNLSRLTKTNVGNIILDLINIEKGYTRLTNNEVYDLRDFLVENLPERISEWKR